MVFLLLIGTDFLGFSFKIYPKNLQQQLCPQFDQYAKLCISNLPFKSCIEQSSILTPVTRTPNRETTLHTHQANLVTTVSKKKKAASAPATKAKKEDDDDFDVFADEEDEDDEAPKETRKEMLARLKQ